MVFDSTPSERANTGTVCKGSSIWNIRQFWQLNLELCKLGCRQDAFANGVSLRPVLVLSDLSSCAKAKLQSFPEMDMACGLGSIPLSARRTPPSSRDGLCPNTQQRMHVLRRHGR